jgi:hypothetical protein
MLGCEMARAKRGVPNKPTRSDQDAIDLSQIPSEEISLEGAEELARLSAETKKDGLSWNKVKAELGL